ncbi:hypothetical protein [Halobellus ordinarius]|uniref:hypothetical protein n=1 Tax=Halobellus ordinarius TaxID=3075120 RepID=UPI0028800912|nr:hypothetical protein [Halobellus sp. ZY16]
MVFGELASVPAVFRFPIGLGAAVVAVFVMDWIMARVPEGTTPPYVAASVLTGAHVDRAPGRLAAVAHYLAGLGTGLLFTYFLLGAEWLLGGASLLSVVSVTVLLYVLMITFFVAVPLPRASGVDASRRSAISRGWAIAAAGYLLVLVPISVGLTLLVS